jgi:SAM-dependent methyltransferase
VNDGVTRAPSSQHPPAFAPSQYGDAFADVYDDWYDRGPAAGSVVAGLRPFRDRIVASGGTPSVLELGVGTGALAIALATDGWTVTGIDASTAMLEVLAAKLGGVGGLHVEAALGDAGDPRTWPARRYSVVLSAWNLVTNLPSRDAQRAMFDGTASALEEGGTFVVEAFVPSPPPRRERRVTPGVASVDGTLVRIHTDADPLERSVTGRHVEMADGRVHVRPWRLCWIAPDELDELATAAGLTLARRDEDWSGTPFESLESSHHVSWYRTG